MERTMTHGSAAAAFAAALFAAAGAQASSPEAWDDFRETVERECRVLAEAEMTEVELRVDPFGTESYGVALVEGREAGELVTRICVMDKASGAAEIGGPLPAAAPASRLDPADAAELETMMETARETLAEISRLGEPLAEEAVRAAETVLEGRAGDALDGLGSGRHRCAVYWYGFLDQGARRVGAHECRLTRGEGGLTVEKLSGERLSAVVTEEAGRLVYAGRSYLEGHARTAYDPEQPANAENDNFGNKVGLAFAEGGRLFLLTTQARGMEPHDPTFFELLVLEPAR